MTRHFCLGLTIAVAALTMTGCATDNTGQGALLGGLFGAGAGAAIGHAAGNTAAGAVIGGVAGAATGAAIGSSKDEQDARNRAAYQQAQAQQAAAAAAAAVSVPDVVAMSQAHVDDRVIIDRIHTRGIPAPVQTNEIIYMHQQGVSDNVIAAMETQPVATQMMQPVQYYAPPGAVIVDGDYYYDRPHYYYPPPVVGFGFGYRR
jgi:hypothetical protein